MRVDPIAKTLQSVFADVFGRAFTPCTVLVSALMTATARDEFIGLVISRTQKSKSVSTRAAGVQLKALDQSRQAFLAFQALDSQGSLYAWPLHATLSLSNAVSPDQLSTPHWPINASDSEGNTVLHLAAPFGDVDLLSHLIQHGADVCAEDLFKRTALHLSVLAGHRFHAFPKIDLLLDARCLIDAQTNDGQSALHYAAVKSWGAGIRRLLERGASMKIRDMSGRTPGDYSPLALELDAALKSERMLQSLPPTALSPIRRL